MSQTEPPRPPQDFRAVLHKELESIRKRRLQQRLEALVETDSLEEAAQMAEAAEEAAQRYAQAAKTSKAEAARCARKAAEKAAEAAAQVAAAGWAATARRASAAAAAAVRLGAVEAAWVKSATAAQRLLEQAHKEVENAAKAVEAARTATPPPEPAGSGAVSDPAAAEAQLASTEPKSVAAVVTATAPDGFATRLAEAEARYQKATSAVADYSQRAREDAERAKESTEAAKKAAQEAEEVAENACDESRQAGEADREAQSVAAWAMWAVRAARNAAAQGRAATAAAAEAHKQARTARTAVDAMQQLWREATETVRAGKVPEQPGASNGVPHPTLANQRKETLARIQDAARRAIESAAKAAELAAKATRSAAFAAAGPEAATAASGRLGPIPKIEVLRRQALGMDLAGLALGGGGIRSATFGLGVLQALATFRLLGSFDYLSTVSGGSYIGGWLAAWVRRERSLANVEKQLAPSRVENARATRQVEGREADTGKPAWRAVGGVLDEEPEPVHHLRAYSRYLTPRAGLLSADTWTLACVYLRNLLMNLLVIVPAVLAVVLLSRVLVWLFTAAADTHAYDTSLWGYFTGGALACLLGAGYLLARSPQPTPPPGGRPPVPDQPPSGEGVLISLFGAVWALAGIFLTLRWWFSLSFLCCAVLVLVSLHRERTRVHESAAVDGTPQPEPEASHLRRWLLLPLVGLLVTGLWIFERDPAHPGDLRYAGYQWLNYESSLHHVSSGPGASLTKFALVFGVALLLLSGIAAAVRRRRHRPVGVLLGCDFVLGLLVGLAVYLNLSLVLWPLATAPAATLTLGVPLLLVSLVLAGYGEMALVGRWLDEYEREWRSRLGAYLLRFAAIWLVFFGTTLYGAWLLQHPAVAGVPVRAAAAAVWVGLSAAGAWVGRSARTGPASRLLSRCLEWLAAVAPVVFLVGLLAALSLLVGQLPCPASADLLADAQRSDPAGLKRWGISLVVCLVLAALFAWTINVNNFSMHLVYANRLVRCYLGASRRKQAWGERLSGPVHNGDRRWRWISGTGGAPTKADAPAADGTPPTVAARRARTVTGFDPLDDFALSELGRDCSGPYLLINAALNLVGGNELADQDRKAAAFVLTPDFCGSRATGYAQTSTDAATARNLTLGRALTISGAAIDPNMGYYQSAPLTALMTVFNTRLGWWLQNPSAVGAWQARGPAYGGLLWHELFGRTDKKGRYVHLSDGGHFENLGAYELIRRRCRFVVVADVSSDPRAATDNLANLLRLVRIDFGIRIEIDTAQLNRGKDGRSTWHCGVGPIHYEDVDEAAVPGVLVYLQGSLTGDETADVRQYADRHPAFPHESTLDQFFSEAQFESYRALGYHIAQTVFGEAVADWDQGGRLPGRLGALVRRRWFPPPPEATRNFTRVGEQAVAVERHLGGRVDLHPLTQDLYPEIAAAEEPATLHAVNEMLQVMQTTWYSMDLDEHHAHPLNLGWMNAFRRWTCSETFHRYWPFLRAAYSQDFVRFCERTLNLRRAEVEWTRLADLSATEANGLLENLNREFAQEWGGELERLGWRTPGRYLSELAEAAVAFGRHAKLRAPLLWLLHLRGTPFPCGLVCAAPWPGDLNMENQEFLVWLRGPYRNLGIGREHMRFLLATIADELAVANPHGRYRLLTCFPEEGGRNAERLEKAMWMNFFFDYGFRTLPRQDPYAPRRATALALPLIG